MQVALVMFRPDGSRRRFPLTRPSTLLGRREDSDFRIPLPAVSRKHCQIIVDGDMVRVEDLTSANGTFVNGRRVSVQMLQPGDTLSVGPVQFVVQVDGVPAEGDIVPGDPIEAPQAEARRVAESRHAAERASAPLIPDTAGASDAEIDDILASDSPADSNADDVLIEFDPGKR